MFRSTARLTPPTWVALLLTLALTEAIASAQAAPTDDPDLAEIEAALAADTAAVAETQAPTPVAAASSSMNPDISFIANVAAAWFSQDDPLQAGGHDPSENGFTLQQLEMAIGKAVDPYFRFDASLVFFPAEVEIEEAYATTMQLPHSLQARVGQFLTRFGRQNTQHLHQWDFVDQPFVLSRAFGGEANRGLGIELSYLTPLPWYVEVVGSVIDSRDEGTGRSFLGGDEMSAATPLDTPLDLQATAALKQFFELSHDWSLAWGLSYATAPNSAVEALRTHLIGTDLFLKYRPITATSGTYDEVSLQSEWIVRLRDLTGGDQLRDLTGYVQARYRFAKRWSTAARYEYGGAAEGAGGPGLGDLLDPAWTEARHRGSVQLTFAATEFSRIRAQASVDAPGWIADPIAAGFLTCEFSIGAHGAHPF